MKNNSSILVFLQLKQIPNLIAGFFNSKSDGNRQLLADKRPLVERLMTCNIF